MRKDVCTLDRLDTKKSSSGPWKVVFLAYREWALSAVERLKKESNIRVVDTIKSVEEYKSKILNYKNEEVNIIVLIGWSWIIEEDTLDRFFCVGMHPSDLPLYRGGSPIQHQIIDGLESTKISLMTISPEGTDVGDIWLKNEWDLTGSTMDKILQALAESTVILLKNFFEHYWNIIPKRQNLKAGSYYKRRSPKDSQVYWEQLSKMRLRDVYNLVRALGSPYPNIYVEDDEGNRLLFKEVEYIPKEEE